MPPIRETSVVIQELLESIHRRHSAGNDGAVADYIPELAQADPAHFGIALATADGRIDAVGDSEVPFTIQSISKPFSYGLALKLLGPDHMQRKVGVEPSGEAFFELLRQRKMPLVLSRCQHLPLDPALGSYPRFSSFDEALEAAENLLLGGAFDALPEAGDQPSWCDVLREVEPELIRPMMRLRRLEPGEAVIERGQAGDSLFIAQSGLYSTTIDLQELDGQLRATRIATFALGMCFGAIAFIAGLPRSAAVICTTGGFCWELLRADFDQLRLHHPQAAIQLLLALARDLGDKLGRTNVQLGLMEQL
jgi:CRP-like cAMP-binding protein